VFRVQGNERQRIGYSGGTSHGNKTKDIRDAVKADLDFDLLVDAADIAIKNMNGDVAPNGSVPSDVWLTGTVRHGSQRKAAVRPAGPSRRTGHCSR
jgi:osmotically-inducible protein OsmY